METEIRKKGKFISKGGNVMQQNLKEIVSKFQVYPEIPIIAGNP